MHAVAKLTEGSNAERMQLFVALGYRTEVLSTYGRAYMLAVLDINAAASDAQRSRTTTLLC